MGKRYVVVGNQSYGLYFGETSATDEEVARTKSLRVENVRHVSQWYGRTGGITSLAACGPCGPRVHESRIGAPAPSALLTHVVNIFDCTEEAVANFAKVEWNDG